MKKSGVRSRRSASLGLVFAVAAASTAVPLVANATDPAFEVWAGGGDGRAGAPTSVGLRAPSALLRLADGRLLIGEREVVSVVADGRFAEATDRLDDARIEGLARRSDGEFFFVGRDGVGRFDLTSRSIGFVTVGQGFEGDDGPLADAKFASPRGITAFGDDLLVADSGNHVVRRVAADGTVTRFAGNGEPAFAGDGGLATEASLLSPAAVSVLENGTVLIADTGNHRIRAVTADGTITTVAGTGRDVHAGDGGPALAASIVEPVAVTPDGDGGYLIAESSGPRTGLGHRVRAVSVQGIITTVAGNGSDLESGDDGPAVAAGLPYPRGLAADGTGGFFVSILNELNLVKRVDAGGIIKRYAGASGENFAGEGAPATQAKLDSPQHVTFMRNGDACFADMDNNRIRCVRPDGTIHTVAGSGVRGYNGDGPALQTQLARPSAVVEAPDGSIVFSDTGNFVVRRIAQGEVTTIAGVPKPPAEGSTGNGGPALAAQFTEPIGLLYKADGGLLIVDAANGTASTKGEVRLLRTDGIVDKHSGPHWDPRYLADDRVGGYYVGQLTATRVTHVAADGSQRTAAGNGWRIATGDGAPADEAAIGFVHDIATDAVGRLYIASWAGASQGDTYASHVRVRVVELDGIIHTVAGTGMHGFEGPGEPPLETNLDIVEGVSIGPDGSLFVSQQMYGAAEPIILRAAAPLRFADKTAPLRPYPTPIPPVTAAMGGIRYAPPGYITTVAGATPCVGMPAQDAAIATPSGMLIQGDELLVVDEDATRIVGMNRVQGLFKHIALTGSRGKTPDGNSAQRTSARAPTDLAIGPDDALYYVDRDNDMIRRIDPVTGRVTTVAGTGERLEGGSNDGAYARLAPLDAPTAIAFSPAGELTFYEADVSRRIRAIEPQTGRLKTIAGAPHREFGGDGGRARDAGIGGISQMLFDARGNLWFADGLGEVRRINASTGVIEGVAGRVDAPEGSGEGGPATEASITAPAGIALEPDGGFYVTDSYQAAVHYVDPAGVIHLIAGANNWSGSGGTGDGGAAAEAALDRPRDLLIDWKGDLLIADTGNHRIRKIDRETKIITTVMGTGEGSYCGDGAPARRAGLDGIEEIDVASDGSILVTDGQTRVREIRLDGGIVTIAGVGSASMYRSKTGEEVPARQRAVSVPMGAAKDAAGNYYIAEAGIASITKVTPDGVLHRIAGNGTSAGWSGDEGPGTAAELNAPRGVVVAPDGTVFWLEVWNNIVRQLTPDGVIHTYAGTPMVGGFTDGAARAATFNHPLGLARGDDGSLYVADQYTSSGGAGSGLIRKISPDGIVTTIAGLCTGDYPGDEGPAAQACFSNAADVDVDASGNIVVADQYGQRVRWIDPAGTIHTIAGKGTGDPDGTAGQGFAGDDGPSTDALLDQPMSVAMDDRGHVFVADTSSSRLRTITLPSIEAPTIATPSQGAALKSATVSVTGMAKAGEQIELLAAEEVIGAGTAGSDGVWRATLTLTDGPYEVVARDSGGDVSPARSFSVDTIAPAIPSVASPIEGSTIATRTVTFSGGAEPSATVTLREGSRIVASSRANSAGSWSVNALLGDGPHSVSVQAVDPAGNPSPVVTRTFVVESGALPPAPPEITKPAAEGLVRQGFTVEGNAPKGTTVRLYADGVAIGSATTPTSGVFTRAASLKTGWHELMAIAVDAAGVASAPSPSVRVEVDATAPVLTMANPADSIAQEITGAANDNKALSRVEVAFRDARNQLVRTVTASCGGCDEGATEGTWSTDVAGMMPGVYSVTAIAYDIAGNPSSLVRRRLIVVSVGLGG